MATRALNSRKKCCWSQHSFWTPRLLRTWKPNSVQLNCRYCSPVIPQKWKPLHLAESCYDCAQHHCGKTVGGQPRWDGHYQQLQWRHLSPKVQRLQLLFQRNSTKGKVWHSVTFEKETKKKPGNWARVHPVKNSSGQEHKKCPTITMNQFVAAGYGYSHRPVGCCQMGASRNVGWQNRWCSSHKHCRDSKRQSCVRNRTTEGDVATTISPVSSLFTCAKEHMHERLRFCNWGWSVCLCICPQTPLQAGDFHLSTHNAVFSANKQSYLALGFRLCLHLNRLMSQISD